MNYTKDIHWSAELEQAVLGACLLEKSAFGRTYGLVESETFYYEAHKTLYKCMHSMYQAGLPIDLLTVADQFHREGITQINTNPVGYFLANTSRHVVSAANLEYHCYILRRMWMEREVIRLTTGGMKLDGSVREQLYQLQSAIQRINAGEHTKDWSDSSELIVNLIKHQDEMLRTQGKGLSTGIASLDRNNGGFYNGQMIVIGARPSVGKSALMGQIALSIAKQKKTVAIISLEMSNNEIAGRLAALETQEDFNTIFRNLYRDENHRASWYNRISAFTDLPIHISDKTGVSATDIRAKVTKLKNRHGLDCLFLDYLQLVSSETSNNKSRTRENEVSEISRACKILAKDLGIPVVVLCQLSRAVTYRSGANRYPQLSDLRESGSIEQDADIVMFLHRDSMSGIETDENGNSTKDQADLIIRKWRNGESNLHIYLDWDGPKMRFVERNNMLIPFSPPRDYSSPILDEDEEGPF